MKSKDGFHKVSKHIRIDNLIFTPDWNISQTIIITHIRDNYVLTPVFGFKSVNGNAGRNSDKSGSENQVTIRENFHGLKYFDQDNP